LVQRLIFEALLTISSPKLGSNVIRLGLWTFAEFYPDTFSLQQTGEVPIPIYSSPVVPIIVPQRLQNYVDGYAGLWNLQAFQQLRDLPDPLLLLQHVYKGYHLPRFLPMVTGNLPLYSRDTTTDLK
jgi:hypothetical protein